MEIQNNKSYTRKWLYRWIFTPLVLLTGWFFLTWICIYSFDRNFNILSYVQKNSDFYNISYNKILAGQKISGNFRARENYLGIVEIRFRLFSKVSFEKEDILIFRIKEQGKSKWNYVNTYRSGFFYGSDLFPFGFPPITYSKGKMYYFEILSSYGNRDNAIALSNKSPLLVTEYQIPKADIFQSKKTVLLFAMKRFTGAMQNINISFLSFIFLLPFIFYFLWLSPLRTIVLLPMVNYLDNILLLKYHFIGLIIFLLQWVFLYYFQSILVLLIFIDIVYLQVSNEFIYIIMVILWLYAERLTGKNRKDDFFVGLIFLLLSPLLFILGNPDASERATIWAYIFLSFSVFRIIIKERFKFRFMFNKQK